MVISCSGLTQGSTYTVTAGNYSQTITLSSLNYSSMSGSGGNGMGGIGGIGGNMGGFR